MSTKTVNHIRVRLSFPMSVGIIASIGIGFLLIHVFESATRSIGWIVFSATIALMLYPALNLLDKFVPRGLGVFALVLLVITLFALPAYTVIDNVNRQVDKLEKSLPQRAEELENEGKFAKSIREFELAKKTKNTLRRIPEWLQGGTREEQLKANADRAIAFVAGGVLMLFFLLYGNRLVEGALSVIKDHEKHDEIRQNLYNAYSKCAQFGWSQIGLSVAAGLTTYVACRLTNIPAAGLLGVWVALWNLVPIFGVVLGSLPVVILAGSQSMRLAVGLLAFFILYEIAESWCRLKLLGPHTLRLDSIITIIVVFGGLELYGLGGALAGLVLASFAHALAGEFAS